MDSESVGIERIGVGKHIFNYSQSDYHKMELGFFSQGPYRL